MPDIGSALPDLIILRDLDETDVRAMRARLAQARRRLKDIDPEQSTDFDWHDHDEMVGGLDREGHGFSLTIYSTKDTVGCTFADRSMPFPEVTASSPWAGLAAAWRLLDRFKKLLQLPRLRLEHVDALSPDVDDRRDGGVSLAQDVSAAIRLMVARFSALHAQYGRPDARPTCLRIVPPHPGGAGDLIDVKTRRSVLSRRGAAAISTGIPRILHVSRGHCDGFVISPPDRSSHFRALDELGPIETLRLMATDPFLSAGAELLATRFRR